MNLRGQQNGVLNNFDRKGQNTFLQEIEVQNFRNNNSKENESNIALTRL